MKRTGRNRPAALLLLLALICGLIPALPGAAAAAAYTSPTVIAANGATVTITGIDPPARTNGMMALYTPAFGASTKTNVYGAEAVLVKTGQPNQYQVVDRCTVWEYLAKTCLNSGNNSIPANGAVLSASPNGTPDVRAWIRDNIKVGDIITVYIPLRSTATLALSAADPTAATNPNGVDPKNGQCYPGCRGTNQLIQYTPAFGARTGTNEFGYELTVAGGRVISRGGSNSPIPADGYVLSGHGTAGSWLSANSILGATVTVAAGKVTIIIDPTAHISNAQKAVEKAEAAVAEALAAGRNVPVDAARVAIEQARMLIGEAEAAYAANLDQNAVDKAKAAQQQASVAWYRTRESRAPEARGVWVRPTETSREAVAATLDKLAQSGINLVYLETFYHGWTIYPSQTAAKYGIEAQRPQFAGFDPLQVWVDEAHARNIELHAWVENFYVGNQALGGPGPVLSAHPEWAGVERSKVGLSGPQPSTAEAGYFFLDPAIPGARQYLQELYTELLTRYAVDGLHLDYIRYPVSLPVEHSFSYSDYSRSTFQAAFGVDPYTISPTTNADAWAQWNLWRQEQVNSFVKSIRDIVDATRPRAALSAAVFPNTEESQLKKLQNWEHWAQHGWMNFLAGMSFGSTGAAVAAETAYMLHKVDGKALIYTGIYSPFHGLSPDVMIEQIEAVRAAGSHGVSLFDWAHLNADQSLALHEGSFRTSAQVPQSTRPVLQAPVPADAWWNQPELPVKGVALPGALVNLHLEGTGLLSSTTADAAGVFTATLASLPEGALELTPEVAGRVGNTVTVNVDRTAPTFTFIGADTYTVDQTVTVTCTAVDALSGLTADPCTAPLVSTPAHTLGLGEHTVTVTATDKAGNTGTATTTYTVTATFGSLINLTEQWVKQKGMATSLIAKLQAAADANDQARNGLLEAFINELEARTDKPLGQEQTTLLMAFARSLQSTHE